jgi:hypothetical protein
MGTRNVGEQEVCRFEAVRQRVSDRTRAKVFNYEVLLAAESAGVGEDVRVLGIEVFGVAVDEGEGVGAQADKSAHVVENGARVPLFLSGIDLCVVGVHSEPGVAAGGEAGLRPTILLHGGAGVVARDLGLRGEEGFGGNLVGVHQRFICILNGDVLVIGERLKGKVRHAELIALEEERCAAKREDHGLEELGRGDAHGGRVVAERRDDAWIVVIGEEDRVPVVLGEDAGMSVVDGFKFRHGPGTELAEAEVGAAQLNGVEVEDHVELVAAVVDQVVGLGESGAGGFSDGHIIVLRK